MHQWWQNLRASSSLDDDPVTRALLAAWLARAGYELLVAQDGEEALEMALEHDPDVVLIDVSMPGLDGLEVCRALQRHALHPPPVIFLTAHSDTRARLAGFEAGAADYVVKPFVRDELLARVRVALRTKAVRDELISHATRDALTGLLSRRELDLRTTAAIAHNHRYSRPWACAILDIDHFKEINDRHGHIAGDEVLRHVAAGLAETCRATDSVARYGGDEFMVLFSEAGAEEAAHSVERFRHALATDGVVVGETRIMPTASIGVSAWTPEMLEPDALYAAADRALYDAKRAGRNRTHVLEDAGGHDVQSSLVALTPS